MFDLGNFLGGIPALANSPAYSHVMNALAPQMTPGGGTTGAPLQPMNALHGMKDPRDPRNRNRDAGQPSIMPVPGMQIPQVMPNPMPFQQPRNMVGQAYNVMGMTPATSPYGLPTY